VYCNSDLYDANTTAITNFAIIAAATCNRSGATNAKSKWERKPTEKVEAAAHFAQDVGGRPNPQQHA